MNFQKFFTILYVSIILDFLSPSWAAFYDCNSELMPLRSDAEAMQKVKEAHGKKFKFSSECLEILLKKNFFDTGEYLMNEYYPHTSIDTEIMVKNVANEIKRNQDYLLFQVKKRQANDQFETWKPVIYWA